jgi:hypothetical protein
VTELSLSHQSITWRVPTKGKCYSQESKKGTGNETYRVKQVRAKHADNRAGVPPYGAQHWQGSNPKWDKKGQGNNLDLGIKLGLLRDDREVSQGILYTESESESET